MVRANKFNRVHRDINPNVVHATRVLKTPRYPNRARAGSRAGLQGDVIFSKADNRFYGHDGTSWQAFNQELPTSGTWTPAFTAISGNLGAANFTPPILDSRFVRVGDIVHIAGTFGMQDVPVGIGNNTWNWAMSLPIATNMGTGILARSRLTGAFNILSSFFPGTPEISDGNAASMGLFGKFSAGGPADGTTAEFQFSINGGTAHTEG